MSMNVYSDKVELWQTPTWLTYVILYDHKQEKRPIEESLHIYLSWVESQANGVWETRQDLNKAREEVRYHIGMVKQANLTEMDII